ncbi:hypothetical protein ABWW58_06530 [Sporolactobacillus sp. STCC-11]|uniref:hypothetical protein n=1 Tax=Sporolactobacillus TaxID=2077 RepID=UPI001960D48F|nr:hypothetical protein [Sporolactobacillus pectinivorans]
MKRVLVVSLAILIVIGGLFIFLNHNSDSNRSSSGKHTESQAPAGQSHVSSSSSHEITESSSQPITDSSTSSVTESVSPSAASSSRTATKTQSNESSTSHSAASESTNTTSGQTSAIQPASKPTGAWVKKFEQDLYKGYHVTPSRYKYIGNGLWEVWVKEYNTGQNPYVTVDQYTGNFHG